MFIEPVFGKKFFGREEVLGTLQKRVTALKGGYRQNLALAGPMLTGKSSILRHFLAGIKDPEVLPIYVELAGDDFPAFSRRMMATLLFQYLKSAGIKSSSDLEALKSAAMPTIPDTVHCVEHILRALKARKVDLAYEALLGLTSVFKSETGRNCIVILDEFHNISNFKLKKPYQTFGKYIMVQKSTMYIVSSSQKTLLKEILSKKLSLLFGNFEVIEVGGFDNQTARAFLSDKMKDMSASDGIADYLIQLCQGSPFYLEILAARFAELAHKRHDRYDAKECLLDALSSVLYESNGIFNQYFTNNINFFTDKRSRRSYIQVLVSLAKGASAMKDIQVQLGRSDRELGDKLRRLQHMDLIHNSGQFYRVSDKLFEYWLRNVYSIKSESVVDDMDIKYVEFKSLMEKDYCEYTEFRAKRIDAVAKGLFGMFNNQKIRIGMYDRKLPRFESIEKRDLEGGVYEVAGRSDGKFWVCRIKEADMADEQDILSFWALKPGDGKSKIVRKIFIPLKGIEHNAFLLAKEQNVWVWDTRQFNEMLRLFGKFEIVL
jgi:AAA+ ATPase superfamily predicted ATPase